MDFYLTGNGERLQFPVNPEQIKAETGSRIITFETIELGEVGFPRGTRLTRISWEGFLPGESRLNLGIVKAWQKPQVIVDQLQRWRNAGTKLRLLVTETPLNLDVYIENFEHSYSGGHGDIFYTLDLVQARDLVVYVYTDQDLQKKKSVKATGSRGRPSPPAPKSYTVKTGDSLWAIAKRLLGSGSRWREIYELNKTVIGKNPNLIFPGQVLKIPAK